MRKRKTYCQIRKKGVSMKRKLDKRSKEIEFKEKELEKREKEFSLKQREIEHKQIASQIDNIASHNIYTSNKGQSGKTHKHSPVPPKLSTDDGKTEWRPYLIQFDHIAKKYNWSDAEKLDKLIECLRDRALKVRSCSKQLHFIVPEGKRTI